MNTTAAIFRFDAGCLSKGSSSFPSILRPGADPPLHSWRTGHRFSFSDSEEQQHMVYQGGFVRSLDPSLGRYVSAFRGLLLCMGYTFMLRVQRLRELQLIIVGIQVVGKCRCEGAVY